MRDRTFIYAPLLIALTLLLNSIFPLLKSPPPPENIALRQSF